VIGSFARSDSSFAMSSSIGIVLGAIRDRCMVGG
jgi:hypothetical protein